MAVFHLDYRPNQSGTAIRRLIEARDYVTALREAKKAIAAEHDAPEDPVDVDPSRGLAWVGLGQWRPSGSFQLEVHDKRAA